MLAALDLGGVCVNIAPGKLIQNVLARTCAAEKTAREERIRFFWSELERGRMETREFFSAVRQICGGAFTEEQIRTLWCGQILDPVPGTFEAARELMKHGYEIVFFSNTSEIHLLEIKRKCPIWQLKKDGVYSFETGAMKPEEEIYACFEKKLGVPAVFFDDNPDNVAAARARGWDARRFTAAADLLSIL